jgi:hypothetical protein
MSQTYASGRTNLSKQLNPGYPMALPRFPLFNPGTNLTYTRPADWLTMPTVVTGDKKIVILYAVWAENSNQTAFIVTGSAGYTVDWGDGTPTQNFASGTQADHLYDYANLGAGTLSSRGYRQAICVITPQGAGTLTSFNSVNRPGTVVGTPATATTSDGMLESIVCSAAMTQFRFGATSQSLLHPYHEQCTIIDSALVATGAVTMFQNNYNFQSLIADANVFANVTDFSSTFNACYALRTLPLLNLGTTSGAVFSQAFQNCWNLYSFAAGTSMRVNGNFNSTFANCYSMQAPPDNINATLAASCATTFSNCWGMKSCPTLTLGSSLTIANNMFENCYNLRTAPMINFPAVAQGGSPQVSLASFFSSCFNLVTVPAYDLSCANSTSSMFTSCFNLELVPALTLHNCATIALMFNGCYSLKRVGTLTTSSALTSMSSVFNNCVNLTVAPTITTTTNVTSTASMFSGCYNLTTVPDYALGNATTMANMFNFCENLVTAPNITTTGSLTNISSMFINCASLETVPVYNWNFATNCDMSQMFGNCPRLISVGGFPNLPSVPGTITMNQMFNQCVSLRTLPSFRTTAVSNMSQMFLSCTRLQTVPSFTGNTNAVTTVNSMFQTCQNLEQIPPISFNNITSSGNAASMFLNCNNLQRSSMANIKYTHSYVNCKMSNVEINNMFSNLGTTTANTIIVTGNPGASTCTTSIATGKGWTVTV